MSKKEKTLKVLHLNYADYGGAGIAAKRLNAALREQGIESRMLVRIKRSDDDAIEALSGMNALCSKLRASLAHRLLNGFGFSLRSMALFPSGLKKRIEASKPDILHMHWINGELLSIADLPRFKIPVVWTLHDMWAFCGAEHCSMDTRYVSGYQRLKDENQQTGSKSSAGKKGTLDLDRWVYQRKQKHWKNWHPRIVTPSNWLAGCVERSALLGESDVAVIPNCLDLDVYKPMDKGVARKGLKLPLDKKLILFGAFDVSQAHKGMDLLEEALHKLSPDEKTHCECVVFGATGSDEVGGIKTTWLGQIHDADILSRLYAAVDLLACPSRVDNLPNTCVEAQSCGTPVVAFDIGGLSDIVEHKRTGYLATPFDVKDLAVGITWVLSQGDREVRRLELASREHAEKTYAPDIVALRYKALYEAVLACNVENQGACPEKS